MRILVCSCDKNADLFEPFRHCMEKYWPEHPPVTYSTETAVNPYYDTVCRNYPLNQWSRRIRETLAEMDDRAVLLMVDDVFIRKPVDLDRIRQSEEMLKGNIACLNYELAFDATESIGGGWGLRRKGAIWSVSIMCGLWDREKLMDVLEGDYTPWEIEKYQPTKGYDFAINTGDYILDWGYRNGRWFGIHGGKWAKEAIHFFVYEGLDIDFGKRGINP